MNVRGWLFWQLESSAKIFSDLFFQIVLRPRTRFYHSFVLPIICDRDSRLTVLFLLVVIWSHCQLRDTPLSRRTPSSALRSPGPTTAAARPPAAPRAPSPRTSSPSLSCRPYVRRSRRPTRTCVSWTSHLPRPRSPCWLSPRWRQCRRAARMGPTAERSRRTICQKLPPRRTSSPLWDPSSTVWRSHQAHPPPPAAAALARARVPAAATLDQALRVQRPLAPQVPVRREEPTKGRQAPKRTLCKAGRRRRGRRRTTRRPPPEVNTLFSSCWNNPSSTLSRRASQQVLSLHELLWCCFPHDNLPFFFLFFFLHRTLILVIGIQKKQEGKMAACLSPSVLPQLFGFSAALRCSLMSGSGGWATPLGDKRKAYQRPETTHNTPSTRKGTAEMVENPNIKKSLQTAYRGMLHYVMFDCTQRSAKGFLLPCGWGEGNK